MFSSLTDFLYPRLCSVCGEKTEEHALCASCYSSLCEDVPYLYIDEDDIFFERWGLFDFEVVQQAVHSLKYHNAPQEGRAFVQVALGNEQFCHFLSTVDIITWVPLHWYRYMRRGYNQAKILASFFTPETSKLKRVLRRSRYTKSQTRFSREARADNMQDVFCLVDSVEVEGKTVLLVDDVVTTGATAQACAAALYDAGACAVSLVTLAQA